MFTVDGHRFRLISSPPLIGLMMDQSAAGNPRSLSGNFFFFLFEDVEKKVGLKSPKLHTPR